MTAPPQPATACREPAGTLADGTPVEAVLLANERGIAARVITYGATLQSLVTPDRQGALAEVTLGFDDVAGYERHQSYFGVTVGRYANRIAGGRFTLDGTSHQLPRNDGANSLHGGPGGFDRRNWTIRSVSSGRQASVVMALVSGDGDMGYPGRLAATVTYALDEDGALSITFEATTDKPTIVNLTNHAMFNLAGDGAPEGAMDHRLTLAAGQFLPVDDNLIPTGEVRPVAGGPFDFTTGRVLAKGLRDGRDEQILRGRGYDHTFVLDKGQTAQPQFAARLDHAPSGRRVDVWTTEPGIQFYTGNFLDGTVPGRSGRLYRMGDGIALEPQKFPDTPNQPAFGSARLDPGQTYRHAMIYRISVAP